MNPMEAYTRPVMTVFVTMALCFALSACTVSKGVVKDIHQDASGNLVQSKCDVRAYLAFYGLIAADENCRDEPISTRATQAQR